MNPFTLVRPSTLAAAIAARGEYALPQLPAGGSPLYKAGGIDVLDHLKEGLLTPNALIHLGLPNTIERSQETITIGAGVTLAQLAAHPLILAGVPALAAAAKSAATPAVRNVATVGGNLLQRPRCWYYRHAQFDCLKKGGSTCFAVEGENQYHAIFGGGPCHIVHPSNIAPALLTMQGRVLLTGGNRTELSLAELYHMPEKGVTSEHSLKQGEVVTHLVCRVRAMSGFFAVKEKQSFDWPTAFACVAIDTQGSSITSASVFAGAVAPMPWRLGSVEVALKGIDLADVQASDAAIAAAAAKAGEGAVPMRDNGYKVKQLATCVHRAVLLSLGRPIPGFSRRG